jgi:hypothetical protein
MDETALFPFADDTDWLLRYCKLPLHSGIGRVDRHGDPDHPLARMIRKLQQSNEQAEPEFAAGFFLPAAGNCRIFLRWPGEHRLSRNFGEGLTVTGDSLDGPFRLHCPRYYVKAASEIGERPGWAIASPVNQPATISYGDPRPVAAVTAIINNFDFEYGNLPDSGSPGPGESLRVQAAGRTVDFAWRIGRRQLRRLVDAGLLGTTSFVTFSFEAWPGASDAELSAFAHNVSSLCWYVVGQHTGIPILSFFDADGRVIRRTIFNAIESKVRSSCALQVLHAEDGLPQLFRQCFDEHCQMQQSDLWRRLPSFCASIEDPPYLEQKYATLMAAVELLIRSSLVEGGHLKATEAESKSLPTLIGMARGTLRWHVPSHYTEAERYRTTRNAVDHGGSLPHDSRQIRGDFDKWKLFLCRRLFIRLGFNGQVASPQNGWASSSPVHEFSEEHNSFQR